MTKPIISHIVVVITGSDASILAAKYAIVMAKTYRCRMSAVYVVDTATIRQLTLSKIFIQEESQEYEKSLEANVERYLSFVEELARAKGVKIEREIRRGAVYTEILTAAEDKKADLIVLGGWEKDRSARDIISTAHREIMVNAKCPVLLVK
ncbi:MAG: universal stress protein [Treponema sp.]|jgi:nucleotide-binding universal stress UspA family protein|nr:universal stress protein [Treponema sp.]